MAYPRVLPYDFSDRISTVMHLWFSESVCPQDFHSMAENHPLQEASAMVEALAADVEASPGGCSSGEGWVLENRSPTAEAFQLFLIYILSKDFQKEAQNYGWEGGLSTLP